ncbi:hypothetical protein AVEN_223130-1 [Araneus ventricosus]|uniref:Uncharacterized protein n=1 Tax=Araneus ventricosus TaxID=182803 RepID=A0A4Y2V823_ARAVE|nr:hypothetical protein AVEN_5243-1 [Araneus ventricosus]GBO21409.1 hypothetical protein AVEN_114982-1 [Araneus ventricosus]GBO21412.1 hypothetical protein AVEN_222367-1 [Araneus ventricosus]GBO21413.1 hypothetical protein AVEN_223130-1 [Araneus ventricosus]
MKTKKEKTETIFYCPAHFKMSKKVKDNFLHVFSACESTPAILRQGKMKFAKLLDKDAEIQKATEVFKNNYLVYLFSAHAGPAYPQGCKALSGPAGKEKSTKPSKRHNDQYKL